jgi:hypothetical protein
MTSPTVTAAQAPTNDDDAVFHDAAWHRTRLGDLLSRWKGGAPHAPTSDDVGSAILDAIGDLVIEVPPASPGAPIAVHEMEREMLQAASDLEEVLGMPRSGGQHSLMDLIGLVAERLAPTRTAFIARHGTSPVEALPRPGVVDAGPFAKMHGELADALGFSPQVAWDTMLHEVRGARESLTAAMVGYMAPGLVTRVNALADATNAVRIHLMNALGAGPDQYAETTLVQLASLVRDRLGDTRARSRAWHDAYRAARGALADVIAGDANRRSHYATAAKNEEIANAQLGRFAVDLDEKTRGVDPA